MSDTAELLVEIGTEELPPTALRRLSEAFARGVAEGLREQALTFGEVAAFATPRRLAVVVSGLATRQPDQEQVRRGPALATAFTTDGEPSKAAEGFARSCGVAVNDLQRDSTPNGAWLVFRQLRPGRPTAELVVGVVEQAVARLPIPKRMRWGAGEAEFVRPVHWVSMLVGEEPIHGSLFGLEIGRDTRGHRFHHPQTLAIPSAAGYAELLRTQGRVEPSFERRREIIRAQVERLAADTGGRAGLDPELLDEVTALCEWPTAIVGSFDERFLAVPREALIETMQKNQKYFPVFGVDGGLLPRFITVSNIESRDPDQVRAGNERVIRPRFADAAFFWDQDRRRPLEDFCARLDQVVFQDRLGTLADKSARVAQIARHLAGVLGLDEELAARAGRLAKCDLMTHMIFEFPSLQGVMGRYYAEHSGEHPCVSVALEEQYLPRQAGDRLPQSDCGRVLALAEKLDTLVGIFAVGLRPTGVKDPYALRRAAIGLLRILIETPLELDLRDLLEFTAEELRERVDAREAAREVLGYALERLKGYYQDQGIGSDVVDAVLAVGVSVPSDIHRRILAVDAYRKLPEAAALTAANKRIRNILRKAEDKDAVPLDPRVLQDDAERRLAGRVAALETEIADELGAQDYAAVLQRLAGLREEVDGFFDQVMVMVDDDGLRRGRLALLRSLEGLFLRVADISRLQ
ncbi:MAG: glycine--tRNA ligase subunit beta [Chromatiaceae bacterium]|jgi:glycyl-tRNA synthetase beta chain|nr:glycine--tRNA ligase subunit beta [Chromatiaceae bacterium]